MQTVTNKVHDNRYLQLDAYYQPEDTILFDIETTGFVADTTMLYMIGCAYYKDGCYLITQWFNDDGKSEKGIIELFMKYISGYKYLLHYNGDGFDIPYLTKKIEKYKLPYSFNNIVSVDLYKLLRPYKNVMHLDNLKQKSLERFIGINRLDKYSGGDLIKIYNEFLKHPDDKRKTLLIQHNYDDLEGLLYCTCLISLVKLKAGCLSVKKMSVKGNRLLFNLSLDYSIPKRISLGINDIMITAYNYEATINVPIITAELKFFFDNYRDYYYLPAEDMAVHKSVAAYVDREYRTQAKRDNCYQKRKGYFISQIDDGIIAGYKYNYKDKESYIELVDSFLQDLDMLNSYARYIIFKC